MVRFCFCFAAHITKILDQRTIVDERGVVESTPSAVERRHDRSERRYHHARRLADSYVTACPCLCVFVCLLRFGVCVCVCAVCVCVCVCVCVGPYSREDAIESLDERRLDLEIVVVFVVVGYHDHDSRC
jgi:hypothetical protein